MRFSRRQILTSLGAGFGASFLGLSGTLGFWFHRRAPAKGFKILAKEEVRFIEAYARAYFPPNNPAGIAVSETSLAKRLDMHFSEFEKSERDLARLLLQVIDNWPRVSVSSTSRFADLSLSDQVAVLTDFDESSLPEKRGLNELMRGLVGMHIFEHEASRQKVGHQFGCAIGGPL